MMMNAERRPDENAFDDERLAMPPMMMLVDPIEKVRDSEPARCRKR
jgi:hypothetical protein